MSQGASHREQMRPGSKTSGMKDGPASSQLDPMGDRECCQAWLSHLENGGSASQSSGCVFAPLIYWHSQHRGAVEPRCEEL